MTLLTVHIPARLLQHHSLPGKVDWQGCRDDYCLQPIGILASVYLVEIPLWSSPNKAEKVSISKMTVLAQTKLTGFKNNMPGYYHAA